MELRRETLTTLRTDDGANLQVDRSNMPLHQAGTRLEAALITTCIVPNTLGLSTAQPLDVLVGIDCRRWTGSGRRLHRLIFGGKRGRSRGRRGLRRASGGMRVVGRIPVVTRARGRRVGV